MNVKGLVAAGLLVGVISGVMLAHILFVTLPRKTIYDRLSEVGITYSEGDWYCKTLKRAEYIQQFNDLNWFKDAWEEKAGDFNEPATIYLDKSFNVLWIQATNRFTSELIYIGFYFYTEPD